MANLPRDITGFPYADAHLGCAHGYILPAVVKALAAPRYRQRPLSIIDLGCGNGAVAARLATLGFDMVGVDGSEQGIAQARRAHAAVRFIQADVCGDLGTRLGRFPVALCLEVIEHVYAPRELARSLFDVLLPGGTVFISTPYHGYLKNLALAVTGRMDAHFTALWDHGHIKFWSPRTLGQLLSEAGFRDIRCSRLGRIPPLAKSMLVSAQRPGP